ncbi:hypothetical protein V6Z11_D06G113700 [Gossypium hirsutum]
MSKISYEHPSHVARVPNRKKNILNDSKAPLRKKIKIHMGKDDVNVSPSVLENWFDLIMKKGGEKYFGENVYGNEISIYPTPSAGYSWLSIDSKDSSCNIFEIPTNSVLKFRFELKEFLLSPTKFGSNSEPFQGRESWLFYMWLAQHIFSRCFDYGISLAIVLVAIKIAQGMYFPLAPLYLGNVYKTLDYYHLKTEILAGRYKILSYVDMSFIQIYFWERFSACAHPPNPGPLNIVPIRLLIGDSASLIGRAFALL